ncbi:hypothetical protein DPEC_G00187040 [Dallia pectoralis]|uniref:Uncharacterized protein n=1 Tax=Dallia pectoralis TaxID=75939 RepID=A0ACC2GC07_DALPE|nr:hypothetical protein DPEC_G00187040 [Dallia pectoralis]
MAGTRTRTGSGPSPYARAADIAELLHLECVGLLDLYKKKEEFPTELNVNTEHLVSVSSSSSQLSANDIDSILRQCRGLLAKVISQEEVFGVGALETKYEVQRKTVMDRLGHLIDSLVKRDGNTASTSGPEYPELGGQENGSLFALKLWIYRVYQELEHWTRTASKSLQALVHGGTSPQNLKAPNPGVAAPKGRGKRRRSKGRRDQR